MSKRHGGLWEFPGGKAEENESDSDAIRRELNEELGVLTAFVGAPELIIRDSDSPYLIVFVPVTIDGQPSAREHLSIRWATVTELLRAPLAPADSAFARHLLSLP